MSDNDTVRLGLDFQRMLRINHVLYIAARWVSAQPAAGGRSAGGSLTLLLSLPGTTSLLSIWTPPPSRSSRSR